MLTYFSRRSGSSTVNKTRDPSTVEDRKIMITGESYEFMNTPVNPFLLFEVPCDQRQEALKALQECYPDFDVTLDHDKNMRVREGDNNEGSFENLRFIFKAKPLLQPAPKEEKNETALQRTP
jgi:hypothetical protein